MRVELFEKLIVVFVVLAVVFVGGMVAAFSIISPRSGVQEVAAQSALNTQDWLEQQRRLKSGQRGVAKVTEFIQLPPTQPAAAAPQQPGQPAPEGGKPAPTTAKTSVDYWDARGQIPQAEQVPGVPWLRRVPGVMYAKPKPVPQIVYQQYQSFDAAWDLAQGGGGEFVETPDGTAYQVNWLESKNLLATRAGIKPGDKVLSVNGQPVGQSVGAGKAMYDSLKGEKRYAVMIERNGQKMVLSFFVD